LSSDVAELLKAFLTHKHRAITIAQRVAIGTLVVDARIIDATPEAAAWYGMADPQSLIGALSCPTCGAQRPATTRCT